MKKFEYKLLPVGEIFSQKKAQENDEQLILRMLNDLGQSGWEVCGVMPGMTILKREIVEDAVVRNQW